jgi:hypothetical protein
MGHYYRKRGSTEAEVEPAPPHGGRPLPRLRNITTLYQMRKVAGIYDDQNPMSDVRCGLGTRGVEHT